MHRWGDEQVDWRGIGDAATFLSDYMRKWGRIHVSDSKEKWGQARVYVSFGWYDLHSLMYPGYHYIQFKEGSLLWKLNYNRILGYLISRIPIHSYQQYIYLRAYRKAIQKWPRLYFEILDGADYPELLRSL